VTTTAVLSNGGTFEEEKSTITCTSAPKNVSTKDNGVHLSLSEEGILTAQADRSAVKGAYKFNVQPVTMVNGTAVVLANTTITVTVDDTKPKATLSSSSVTVNSNFANTYTAGIKLTSNMTGCKFTFTTDNIEATDKKEETKAIAEELKRLMKVEYNVEEGTATIVVSLPKNEILKNGTYNFKVTPQVTSGTAEKGDEEYEYARAALNFKVTIEDKKPTIASATVKGNLDLVKRDTPVTIQIALSKQNYDSVAKIKEVNLYDKGTTNTNAALRIETDEATNGLIKVYVADDAELAKNVSFAETLSVTTTTGQTYTKDVTIKTTQSTCTVKAAESNTTFYTSIGETSIPLTVTDGITLSYVDFKAKSTFSVTVKGKKTTYNVSDYFDCELYYEKDGTAYVHLWAKKTLPDGLTGTKLTLNFTAIPVGNATNQAASAFSANVTFK
jgi:hypothetical protein